jgi:predicted nucleic acid-binding protein
VGVSSSSVYLVDTSIWIGLQRGELSDTLSDRLLSLLAAELIATNNVVRTEMLVGCRTEPEYNVNGERFSGLVELRLNHSVWEGTAALGFSLRRRGVTVALPDLLIAASALEHDAVVVHADKDFDKIAAHSDLRVESYAESSV